MTISIHGVVSNLTHIGIKAVKEFCKNENVEIEDLYTASLYADNDQPHNPQHLARWKRLNAHVSDIYKSHSIVVSATECIGYDYEYDCVKCGCYSGDGSVPQDDLDDEWICDECELG